MFKVRETCLKFLRKWPWLLVTERLIIWITASRALWEMPWHRLLPSLLSHWRKHFSSLNVLPRPHGPKDKKKLLKVYVCMNFSIHSQDSLPRLHLVQSVSIKVVPWLGFGLRIRNAAAIFITESESVFKPEQIVCHLFKGKRCFLNRPERTWAKELWNCQHLSVLEGWQCEKNTTHVYSRSICKKFNYFMSTLQVQNLRSQWEGARIWQQWPGVRDQELQVLVCFCHLSFVQS